MLEVFGVVFVHSLVVFAAVSLLTVSSLGASQGRGSEGEEIYNRNCSACHQPTGAGIPGAFPPLAGPLPDIVALEGGRDYLVRVLVYGLQGQIVVAGETYSGVMSPWPQLSDQEIAAVLNHELRSWGNRERLPGSNRVRWRRPARNRSPPRRCTPSGSR